MSSEQEDAKAKERILRKKSHSVLPHPHEGPIGRAGRGRIFSGSTGTYTVGRDPPPQVLQTTCCLRRLSWEGDI